MTQSMINKGLKIYSVLNLLNHICKIDKLISNFCKTSNLLN